MISSRALRVLVLGMVGLALLGSGASVALSEAEAASTPGTLLAFHGWPSRINGSVTVAEAASNFGRYDFVVLPGTTVDPDTGGLRVGVEDPSHPDHVRTAAIIAHEALADTFVVGYVNLGVSNGGLTLEQVYERVRQWEALGVDGIQFDAMGYDWEVTRARQNAAIDYVHGRGLPVVANAWLPEDVFDPAPDADWNPGGLPSRLGADDYYLFESFWVRLGQAPSPNPAAPSGWTYAYFLDKAQRLAAYQAALGFSILSVTTNSPADAYSQELFNQAWGKAAEYGHAATGWGEYLFSANDALAPYRPRPAASGEPQFVCSRQPATIIGTVGADRISGTEHPDVIVGLGGPDIITGGAGRDIICGNAGNDTIRGGGTRDRLLGGAGADSLFGDAGNDRLLGQGGNDFLVGGMGIKDLARGGPLIDTCDAEIEYDCEH